MRIVGVRFFFGGKRICGGLYWTSPVEAVLNVAVGPARWAILIFKLDDTRFSSFVESRSCPSRRGLRPKVQQLVASRTPCPGSHVLRR